MIIRQTIMVLDTIMENPGLCDKKLGAKIEEIYGKKNEAVQFMFLEEMDKNSHFYSLIKSIYCIEKKDDCYYYNPALPLTDKQDLTQCFIEGFLESKRLRKQKKS